MSRIEFEQIYRHNIAVTFATTPFKTRPSLRRSVALARVPVPHEPPAKVWGFSYGSSRAARTRATYEVYERLFAFRPFRSSYLPASQLLPECFSLIDGEPTPRIPSKYLFVYEGPPDHSAGNGAGAHTTLRAAIGHGLEEVIERHLLCSWWYEGAFRLQAAGPTTELQPGVHMSSWTVSGGGLPFCLAVIHDEAETVFVTGSKVASTINKARNGAEREAFVLYDSLLVNPRVDDYPRMASLIGPLAERRIAHFRASLGDGRVPAKRRSRRYSTEEVVEACGKSLQGARFAVLADLPRMKVAKVHCPGWLTKALARAKHEHPQADVPPDPFC